MALVIKKIKPARLNKDAFRTEMLNAMRKAGTQIKADFEKTTATWKNKPKFEVLVSLTGPGPVVLVDTNNEIYGYVSGGTKPHPIFAGIYTGKSNKKVLAFSSKFTPKTMPGVIGSSPGGSGAVDTFRPYVNHPGTKARNFHKLIAKKREKWFLRQMEAAMATAAKKSGHSL